MDFDPTKILLKISPWECPLKFGLEFILLRFTQLLEIPRLPRQNPGQLGLAPEDPLGAGVNNRVRRVVCVEDVVVAVDGLKDRELNTKRTLIRLAHLLGPAISIIPTLQIAAVIVLLLGVEHPDVAIITHGIVCHDTVTVLKIIATRSQHFVPDVLVFVDGEVLNDIDFLALILLERLHVVVLRGQQQGVGLDKLEEEVGGGEDLLGGGARGHQG